MSEVLYRKFRPQKFADVIGQGIIKTILQNAIQSGRLAHAYLFTGPRGVGKTTMARLLAKAVNCEKRKGAEPCDKCNSCLQIREGRFLDLIEIDAASYTGVDNIRDVIEHTRFAPNQGKYKVFIIDEVHMLSKAAFNALLKTLEETPAHAIFILATTEVGKVPATIISRTQRFDFSAVSQADILELLGRVLKDSKAVIGPEARRLIARAAQGSLRDSLSILDQILGIRGDGTGEITLDEIESILGFIRMETLQNFMNLILEGRQSEAGEVIKQMSFEGKDLVQFTREFLDYLRLTLLIKIRAADLGELGLIPEEAKLLQEQADRLSGSALSTLIKNFMTAYREIVQTPIQELPLLVAVFDYFEKFGHHEEKKQIAAKEQMSAKEPAPKSPGASGLSLSVIVDNWGKVLTQIKEYNHSLISSLRLGRIIDFEENIIILAFPYSFHKETVEARKNKIVVEQVLEDVFGEKLKIKVLLEKELNIGENDKTGSEEDLISQAMRVLGNKE